MPRSAAEPMPKNVTPALRAALELVDRRSDPWLLANRRPSILGDAHIYFAVPRLRESALVRFGITTREHGAVREALRARLMCERTNAVELRFLAACLIGERRLAREGTAAMARRFAPQLHIAAA